MTEAASSEQSLGVSQACSTVICGTSTTSRVDSAPAWPSSGFCARASHSQMDLLCRTPPSASPAQRKKKMSCAHEAHVSTRTARSRRSARSSRSRSRRWQASGGEPGGEEGACPAALRTAAGKQQALRPVPATTARHRATVLALASESDETSRRSSPASPAHRPARCGRAPDRRHSAVKEARTRRAQRGQTVWPIQRTSGLAACCVDFLRCCLAG